MGRGLIGLGLERSWRADCTGANSPWLGRIAASRAAFDARFTTTDRYQPTTTEVAITGVGFFDKKHGQRGVASNGVELHPVLAIRIS